MLTHTHFRARYTYVNVILFVLLFITILMPINSSQFGRNEVRSRADNQTPSTALEGKLSVFIIDQESGESQTEYYLETGNNRSVQLQIDSENVPKGFASGAKVNVKGNIQNNALVVNTSETDAIQVLDTPQATINASSTSHTVRTAVILFNFRNNPIQPLTVADVQKQIFTNIDSSKYYFKEVSYGLYDLQGKTSPDGDVFGWYTIPYDLVTTTPSTDCPISEVVKWRDLAKTEAQKSGKDLNNYDKFIFMLPVTNGCSSFFGLTGGENHYVIIKDPSWPISDYRHVLLHEIEHGLSLSVSKDNNYLDHAIALSCTDVSGKKVQISNTCTTTSLDPYEPLGIGLGHPSATHKEMAGWLSPENIQTVTTAGTYTLAPQEPTSSKVQLIKIPRNTSTTTGKQQYYTIEYRQPFGVDQLSNFFDTIAPSERPVSNVFKGVTIRLTPLDCPSCDTGLIDATPETSNFGDATFEPGQVFFDGDQKISIQTIDATAVQASVAIKFGASSPTPFFTPSPNITVTVPNPTSSPENTTRLSLQLLLHGIGSAGDAINPTGGSLSNKDPKTPQRDLLITITDSTNNQVFTKVVPINYDTNSGRFTGTVDLGASFKTGSYTLKLSSDRYLQKTVPLTLNTLQNNQIPPIELSTGDTNGDNVLNIVDYNALLDCGYGVVNPLPISDMKAVFNTSACKVHTPATNTDIEDNGIVDSRDYNLFLRELSKN